MAGVCSLSPPANAVHVVAVGEGGTIRQTSDSGGNWFVRASGTTDALHAVDAIGSKLWAVGVAGKIIHSADGGITWNPQVSGVSSDLNAVDFVDENVGWAVGAGGKILRTVNGGANWSPQVSSTGQPFNAVKAIDVQRAWAIETTVRRTIDGGANWSFQTAGGAAVDAVSATHAWLANGSSVGLTTDGGANWTSIPAVSTSALQDVDFLDQSLGWVAGTQGNIHRTINGGIDWEPAQSTGTNATFNAISMLNELNGWVVGGLGTIRNTIDGGLTWQGQSSGTFSDLLDVATFTLPARPDFDVDGNVDGADFLIWQRGVGRINASFEQGDASEDGLVDEDDLLEWNSAFASVRGTSVPEPTTLALVILGFLWLRRPSYYAQATPFCAAVLRR